jgi:hypothetical protein
VPALTPGQQRDIPDGRLLLDQMTRSFIREHLGYGRLARASVGPCPGRRGAGCGGFPVTVCLTRGCPSKPAREVWWPPVTVSDELEALAPSSDAQQDRSDWHPQKETP